jgi:hypothetical protein
MTATLLALVVAVLTVIAYVVLAERIEYSSVRRRQLDAWAAATAMACLGGIVYGGVATRASRHDRDRPAVATAPAAPADAPGRAADLGRPVVLAPAPSPAPVQLLAPGAPLGLIQAPNPAPSAPGLGAEEPVRPVRRDAAGVPLAELPSPTPGVASAYTPAATGSPVPTSALTVPSATRPLATATTTPAGVVSTRVAPPPAQPTRTRVPSTSVVPTVAPLPLPTSTPNCGNPSSAQVAMSGLTAAADRSGEDVLIRFQAQVRNDSPFPVTLADISATATNRVAGSEQYGHTTLSDISIEPGAVITLEGSLTLNKLPPPFGTTELCLSFALDSCGARADRPMSQCAAARGF